MSDLRIQSQAPMSIDPSMQGDPADAVSRADRPPATGARGTSGQSQATGSGGAAGAGTAPSVDGGTECMDEILSAAGTCGAAVLSAGALALVAGVACAGNTMTAIECLQREAEARSPAQR